MPGRMRVTPRASISGVGAGGVYGTCVGNALKWFPDRRGLAAGLTAAGFGAGSALTILPISALLKSNGYESAFLYFGLIQGGVVFLLSLALTDPRRAVVVTNPARPQRVALPAVPQSKRDFTTLQMLATPSFWLLYLAFVLVAAGAALTGNAVGFFLGFGLCASPVFIIALIFLIYFIAIRKQFS